MIRVIVNGACGRMGKMITQGVSEQEDMQIVGAIEFSEHPQLGQDVGESSRNWDNRRACYQ